jgi:hypothetical protein
MIAFAFGVISKSVKNFWVKDRGSVLKVFSIVLFSSVYGFTIFSVDVYWIIRNYLFVQIIFLILLLLNVFLVCYEKRVMEYLKFIDVLGKSSLLVYFGHYFIYASIGVLFGLTMVDLKVVVLISFFTTLSIFFFLNSFPDFSKRISKKLS